MLILKLNLSSFILDYSCLVGQLGVLAAGVHQKCLKTNKELLIETWKPFLNWTHHPEVQLSAINND